MANRPCPQCRTSDPAKHAEGCGVAAVIKRLAEMREDELNALVEATPDER